MKKYTPCQKLVLILLICTFVAAGLAIFSVPDRAQAAVFQDLPSGLMIRGQVYDAATGSS